MDNQFNFTTIDNGRVDFRQGSLPNLPSLKSSDTAGVITAPGDYFNRKYKEMKSQAFPYDGMFVSYSLSQGWIVYAENIATDTGGVKITGKLNLEPNLDSLGINTNKSYSPAQLSDALKMLRVLFADKDSWSAIVTNLKNFTAEATSRIEKENDDKGNKKENLVQTLSTSFDLSFELSTAIFSGYNNKESFKVEILVTVRSSALEMYLQSVELKELLDGAKEKIVLKELEKFADSIPTIQVS